MAMTFEQFEELAKTLPEGTDHRRVARALGVELPPEPVAPLDEQLADTSLVKHTPKATKRNPSPEEVAYVSVPSLKLDESSGTRGFWVNTRVARQIANKILEVCDENNL